MNGRSELLSQPLLDHRLPRHQAEPHAVIEHRVAPAGEHHASPVDARYALPIGEGPMLQPGFSGNVFAACDSSRLRSVAGRLRVRMMRCPRRSVRP